jgi:hypothetical protein
MEKRYEQVAMLASVFRDQLQILPHHVQFSENLETRIRDVLFDKKRLWEVFDHGAITRVEATHKLIAEVFSREAVDWQTIPANVQDELTAKIHYVLFGTDTYFEERAEPIQYVYVVYNPRR